MGEKKFLGNEKGLEFVEEERSCLVDKLNTTKFKIRYVCTLGNVVEKCKCIKTGECGRICGGFIQNFVDENKVEDLKNKYKIEIWGH